LTSEPAPDALVIGDLEPVPQTSLALISDLRQERAFQRLPIIMVSTQATPADIAQGKAVGADRYLTKPFRISELITNIQELFDDRHAA
jgi:DNA-binding response OmpR family regulator